MRAENDICQVTPENTWCRYRSRPIECEAMQFDPHGAHRCSLPEFVTGIPAPGADNWAYEGCQFHVTVQVGDHLYKQAIQPLDWIVRTEDGNWRACPDAVFKQGFIPAITPDTVYEVSNHTAPFEPTTYAELEAKGDFQTQIKPSLILPRRPPQ